MLSPAVKQSVGNAGVPPLGGQRRRLKLGRERRFGLTLVEILISTAVTMIMIYAIVRIFEQVGAAVAQGRAAIEMSGQIRGAAHRLREDLRGVTVPMRPWPRSSSAEGYFEYLEGPDRDITYLSVDSTIGDRDDGLMFTARSVDEPYVGRLQVDPTVPTVTPIESQVAEIVWWTRPDSTGSFSLHRRVLLVRPDLNGPAGTIPGWGAANLTDLQKFYHTNDVSVRLVPNPSNPSQFFIVANTLADLTKRENRFAHTGAFPFAVNAALLNPPLASGTFLPPPGTPPVHFVQSGTQYGDDVILSHVRAFDIRAFDPLASIRNDGNRALIPSDPGWPAAPAASAIGTGAFVDLGYLGATGSVFSAMPHMQSGMAAGPAVYCTWSFHYEHDGIDQDKPPPPPAPNQWRNGADQGTNGLDDDGLNGPDDALERETSPPYPVPLRGIQIKIRIDDTDSRQVREATVVHDFVPE